ncbi:unnamed protein product [Cunninghamella echinulata]
MIFSKLTIISLLFISNCFGQNFYGLNFGIDQNNCPPSQTYVSHFNAIKKYTNRVRSYSLSVCNQGALALEAAHSTGMNIYLGMWVDRPDTFQNELKALKNLLANHDLKNVEAIIVGSEVLYRKDTPPSDLANYIKQIKSIVGPHGVSVTTADVFYTFTPDVIDAVDFVMMNAFPYWEGVEINDAATTLFQHYDSVVSVAKGKKVKIAETGWPGSGSNFGSSVASPQNQAKYLKDVLCLAKKRGVDVIYFSAYDEPYRGNGVEGSFGIMNSGLSLKSTIKIQDLTQPC